MRPADQIDRYARMLKIAHARSVEILPTAAIDLPHIEVQVRIPVKLG